MRISDGIAQITVNSSIKNERVFMWPLYNAGRVEKIHGIARQMESNALYSKPTPDDHSRLLNMSQHASEEEYTATGAVHRRNILSGSPGSFFDAVV